VGYGRYDENAPENDGKLSHVPTDAAKTADDQVVCADNLPKFYFAGKHWIC
jgi:hypothetical protein